jgi:hypothetical protein
MYKEVMVLQDNDRQHASIVAMNALTASVVWHPENHANHCIVPSQRDSQVFHH